MSDRSAPAVPDRPVGRIDRVRTGPAGLNVAGWARAGRVTLFCGGRSVSARPDLPRPDTAAQLGQEADGTRVGYDLTLPDPGPGPAVLVLDPAPGQPGATTVLPVPGTGAPRRAPRLLRLLPRRVAALFDRYAAEHLDCTRPGPALTDRDGAALGHVDRIRVTGTRLSVEGWANARRVILQTGNTRRTATPEMPRTDVAEATGLPGDLGFYIDAVVEADDAVPPVLLIEPRAGAPVALALPWAATDAARRRLVRRFLGALLRAAPAVALWRLTRAPRHRATIKRILGLTGIAPAEGLDPALFAPGAADGAALPAPADGAPVPAPADTPVTIVLPVYNAFDLLTEVLDRVVRHTDLPFRLVLVEDASPDARVRPFLRDWAARQNAETAAAPGRVELIENETNLGFIGAVNRGLEAARAAGHPVVLLNSDAFVPAGWAGRLIAPILADDSVATVTPMSNDAEIFSVPAICTRTPLAPGMADAIDAVAQGFAPAAARAEAPTGVGFCMAIAPAFLARIPGLDPAFGRGYGEEVDWCQKARAQGGRHLGIATLFVEHRGGESFGSAEKLKLVAANNARIARRYPGYDAEVQGFIAADPLVTPRLALAVAWAAAWTEAAADRRVPVYLAHSLGGGAETYLQQRIAEERARDGRPALILRVGGARRWRLEAVSEAGVTAGETADFALVRRLLAPLARREIVYSCGVGDPDPAELPERLLELAADGDATPIEVLFHDFFPLSPSYTLLDGDGRYRGPLSDPAARAGDRAHRSLRADGRAIGLADWQEAWARLMAAPGARVTVFSDDSRRQILAARPDLDGRIRVRPHRLPVTPPAIAAPPGGRRVIAAYGNIGYQKGAAVLQALAARMAGPDTPDLVVIGNIDPAYPLPAHVPVHGSYRVADLPQIVARHGITDWLIPSVWPETFSYTTHEALATGLPVWAFDIGAQGDAVRAAVNGHAVPFDASGHPARDLLNCLSAAMTAPTTEARSSA